MDFHIEEPIRIPDGDLPYLVFQGQADSIHRKSRFLQKILFNRFPRFFTYERVVRWESKVFPGYIRREANIRIPKHFKEIEPYLPKTAQCILDIASGQGMIDILLFRHFQNPDLEIHLLDKFILAPEVTHGFQNDAPGYASAKDAEDLLRANGVKSVYIHFATSDSKIDSQGPFDLIISLAGWGFMFPVEGYLDQIYELMAPNAVVITDLRKGTPQADQQEALVRKKWGNLTIITEWKKGKRVALRK